MIKNGISRRSLLMNDDLFPISSPFNNTYNYLEFAMMVDDGTYREKFQFVSIEEIAIFLALGISMVTFF